MSYHCSSSELPVFLKSLKQDYTEILTVTVIKPLTFFIQTTYLCEKEFLYNTIKIEHNMLDLVSKKQHHLSSH